MLSTPLQFRNLSINDGWILLGKINALFLAIKTQNSFMFVLHSWDNIWINIAFKIGNVMHIIQWRYVYIFMQLVDYHNPKKLKKSFPWNIGWRFGKGSYYHHFIYQRSGQEAFCEGRGRLFMAKLYRWWPYWAVSDLLTGIWRLVYDIYRYLLWKNSLLVYIVPRKTVRVNYLFSSYQDNDFFFHT